MRADSFLRYKSLDCLFQAQISMFTTGISAFGMKRLQSHEFIGPISLSLLGHLIDEKVTVFSRLNEQI